MLLSLSLSLSLSDTHTHTHTLTEKALSEAHKSLDKIRSEMLAWQSQYSDVRKELNEVKGTSDTLRVS